MRCRAKCAEAMAGWTRAPAVAARILTVGGAAVPGRSDARGDARSAQSARGAWHVWRSPASQPLQCGSAGMVRAPAHATVCMCMCASHGEPLGGARVLSTAEGGPGHARASRSAETAQACRRVGASPFRCNAHTSKYAHSSQGVLGTLPAQAPPPDRTEHAHRVVSAAHEECCAVVLPACPVCPAWRPRIGPWCDWGTAREAESGPTVRSTDATHRFTIFRRVRIHDR